MPVAPQRIHRKWRLDTSVAVWIDRFAARSRGTRAPLGCLGTACCGSRRPARRAGTIAATSLITSRKAARMLCEHWTPADKIISPLPRAAPRIPRIILTFAILVNANMFHDSCRAFFAYFESGYDRQVCSKVNRVGRMTITMLSANKIAAAERLS
jgi:hypothetical protein